LKKKRQVLALRGGERAGEGGKAEPPHREPRISRASGTP